MCFFKPDSVFPQWDREKVLAQMYTRLDELEENCVITMLPPENTMWDLWFCRGYQAELHEPIGKLGHVRQEEMCIPQVFGIWVRPPGTALTKGEEEIKNTFSYFLCKSLSSLRELNELLNFCIFEERGYVSSKQLRLL